MNTASPAYLGWLGIMRLGLVQTSLGAIVVLMTSTFNRVMVVELALPAVLPGLLVGLHYGVQILRPRLGYGSDMGGRRTPWIIGGMFVLAAGGIGAALATALMAAYPLGGLLLAIVAFTLIGVGVGASGTSLLVLLASRVAPDRRAAAATITWVMMIAGFVVTTTIAGHLLDPFSGTRLVMVSTGVCVIAVAVTLLAVWRMEPPRVASPADPATATAAGEPVDAARRPTFMHALGEVWREPEARRFTLFVFLSMLAFSMHELIIEPFAGLVFGYTPGESTRLAGMQHGGVLFGMITVALACSPLARGRLGSLRGWMIGGCIASAAALLLLATAAFVGTGWPLRASVFALGCANGAFAVAAIASMMSLVAKGRARREGVRMGMWGAAQAIAFGVGGLLGTIAFDATRALLGTPVTAFATVFTAEAALFIAAAVLGARLSRASSFPRPHPVVAPVAGPQPAHR